jgi:nucleoside-diphosphate-sugar epimerase
MNVIRKVLVTGVYGLVGNVVYPHLCSLSNRFEVYGADRHRSRAGFMRVLAC